MRKIHHIYKERLAIEPKQPVSNLQFAKQRRPPLRRHCIRKRIRSLDRALGAQVPRAPKGGAARVPIPEHPNQELLLWRR